MTSPTHPPRALPSSTRASGRDLQREHRRLRRAFTAILCALAPAALVQACEPLQTPHGGASFDAGTGVETGADASSLADADAAPSTDAPPDASASCALVTGQEDASPDGDPICFYTLPCGLPKGLSAQGCEVYAADGGGPLGCSLVEGEGCQADAYSPGEGGAVTMACPGCLGGGGRRPRGLVRPRRVSARTALGAYFARMAHDEAASVYAFRRMRDELASHGAPPALVRAAQRAACDEERHARAMERYARLHGAPVPAARVRRAGARSLEAMARENAVEGCVRETFGALLLQWQAAHAQDASVRRTFARISADEARHAALSWAVARWLEPRLDDAGRARVSAARARALRGLRRAPSPVAFAFDAPAGRPLPAVRAALLDGMIQQLDLA